MEKIKTVMLEVRFRVRDAASLAEYQVAARETLSAAGGEPALRGVAVRTLLGDGEDLRPGRLIVRFPSREALEEWFASPAYQALSDLREEAMDAVFHVLEVSA